MAIVEARSQIIAREPSSVLGTSYADATPAAREHVIVTLLDDSGLSGYGEASPLPFFTGETPRGIDHYLRATFLPLLVGRDPFALGAIHAALDRLPGHTSAKAAIDIALHDLQGKLTGRPVVDLLGGPLRERVPVTYPIGIRPVREAVAEAEGAVARGIRTLKLKVGRDPQADVERVSAIRRAVGDAIRLRIDANAGYSVPIATRLIDRLAPLDLEYVEQPVAAWDHRGLAAVRRATGVPVMADESLHSLRDAMALIEAEAADIFAIKLIKCGGLYPARAIVQLAAAWRIDIVVISPFETQIGAAAGLALALAAPTGERAHELRVFDSQPHLATTGITFQQGDIVPTRAPGLGVETIRELQPAPESRSTRRTT
jgi:L-alanine-DL-glutamate epimerase-like enolase superfamily enzyme